MLDSYQFELLECKIEVAIIFWVNDTSMLLLISIEYDILTIVSSVDGHWAHNFS